MPFEKCGTFLLDGTHSVVGGCFAFCVRFLCFKTFCVRFSPEVSGYSRTKVQGCPHGSHTRLQIVPYTAAIEVLS